MRLGHHINGPVLERTAPARQISFLLPRLKFTRAGLLHKRHHQGNDRRLDVQARRRRRAGRHTFLPAVMHHGVSFSTLMLRLTIILAPSSNPCINSSLDTP